MRDVIGTGRLIAAIIRASERDLRFGQAILNAYTEGSMNQARLPEALWAIEDIDLAILLERMLGQGANERHIPVSEPTVTNKTQSSTTRSVR